MDVPSREDPIESLSDLATVEDEYNATVDSHVHAVVLTEVLGLLGDYMANICEAYEESEMLLAERLISLHTRHVELGGSDLALPTSAYPEDVRTGVLGKASIKRAARNFRFQLPTLQTSVELDFPASSNVASDADRNTTSATAPNTESASIRFALSNVTKLQLILSAADDIVLGILRRAYRLYDRLGKDTKRQMSAYINRLINVRLALEARLRCSSTWAFLTGMDASSSSATLGVTIGSAEAFNSSSHSENYSHEHLGSSDLDEEGPRPPLVSDEDEVMESIVHLRLADEYWRFANGIYDALEALYTHELGVSSKAPKRHGHGHGHSSKSKRAKSKATADKLAKDPSKAKTTAHASSQPAKHMGSQKPGKPSSSKPATKAKHSTKRSLISRLHLPFFQRTRRHGDVAL